jgi:hypothetical protein
LLDKRARTVAEFLTLWIKNNLIPYPIGGMPRKPVEKRGFLRLATPHAGMPLRMRVMFFTWLLLIATGLVFYTVIGLAHN